MGITIEAAARRAAAAILAAVALLAPQAFAGGAAKDLSVPAASCLYDNFSPWVLGFSLVCSEADLADWAADRSANINELELVSGEPPEPGVQQGLYEAPSGGDFVLYARYVHDTFQPPVPRTKAQVRAAYLATLGINDAEARAGSAFTPTGADCASASGFVQVGTASTQFNGSIRLFRHCAPNPAGPYAGKTALYIEGHGGSVTDLGLEHVDWLASLGFQVYGADMPISGSNFEDPAALFTSHDAYWVLEDASKSPLWTEFLAPLVSFVNVIRGPAGGAIGVYGRSGGGMTAYSLATLHEGIDYAVSISGGTPLSMRLGSPAGPFEIGDWEQWSPRTYRHVGHEELMRSAGRLGGLYAYAGQDPCCFQVAAGDGFYEWMGEPTGDARTVALVVDPLHTGHSLSDAQKPLVLAFLDGIFAAPVLSVATAGTGAGSVASSPAGIDCGLACAASFSTGSTVTLVAAPVAGSTFLGWSDAGCPGTAPCVVTMDVAKTVTATFSATLQALAVTLSGSGSGAVSSDPSGIDCGATCAANFNFGTSVTLAATPGAGSVFAGWSEGGCTGTAPCTVTMDQARAVTATFATPVALTASKAGTGSGTVSSDPAGIDCGLVCSIDVAPGTPVTLTATPAAGSLFTGWSGAGCTGTSPCVVTMDVAKTVTATFVTPFALVVAKGGTGTGSVTSNPAGIDCGLVCTFEFAPGTLVTLDATPATGSVFAGWVGEGCGGTGPCVVTMDAAKLVTASFPRQQYALSVANAGSGSVSSAPAGIGCGPTCTANFDAGATVTLSPIAASGWIFVGWSLPSCAGTGPCVLTMDAAKSVTATFAPLVTLAVSKAGAGSGSVSSSPAGIDCGPTCSRAIAAGTAMTLTAAPSANSLFTGWSGGGCAGTGTCVVAMNANTSVTATFVLRQFPLTVVSAGDGQGTVASAPAAITCPGACTAPFDMGTVVALSATPAQGSLFSGWSGGGCSGTGACAVTIDAAKSVTATFTVQRFALTVWLDGGGSGSVASTPAGINCLPTCVASFPMDATVTLVPTPAAGSIFAGWSGGACSGAGPCVVAMSAAKGVSAAFVPGYTLTVAPAGSGTGTVVSTPAGISCGATCAASFASATVVTLTATAAAGSAFAGWSGGGCSGTGPCVVTMAAAAAITPAFAKVTDVPRLVNVSTRGPVLNGEDVMIAGIIVGGGAAKKVQVNARGPSLPSTLPGVLADPTMNLYSGAIALESNDNWGSGTKGPEILGNGFAPPHPLESSILATLDPGPYTAVVSGVGGGTGIGIVEVFEVHRPDLPLIGLATRGRVMTGDKVLIAGFIIQGNAPLTVVIRARGPSLAEHGVVGVLENPMLRLVPASGEHTVNDDWGSAANAAELQQSGFAPLDPRESAILVTLPPGAYTAIMSGVGDSMGVGIVEVFAR